MTKQELLEKANGLPFTPGVYIMRSKNGKVIYVGKSKVLRQRVSQYFEDTEHNIKTEHMVNSVYDFDYMLTDTEMEALALENRLIKLHQPKYNIRLKDAKSYPYVKVTQNEEYPRISVTRTRDNDGAKYFGPYSSINTAYSIMRTAQTTFGLPSCKKRFPEDIGRERPCLYKQMGRCIGLCTGEISAEEYREIFREVIPFLRGSFTDVRRTLEDRMNAAAEELMFETAAKYRDRIRALDRLLDRQNAVGPPEADQDVFAFYSEERCSCLSVFFVRMGFVSDSQHFVFPPEQLAGEEDITDFICDLYTKRSYVPREILIGFPLGESNTETLTEFISTLGAHTKIRFPERGNLRALCDMVAENARIQSEQYLAEADRDNRMLVRLASLLGLEVVPQIIEAYDISNMGNDAIVAGMVCAEDGKFKKSAYRTYNIRSTDTQDDYASMREAITRRLTHGEGETKLASVPDLILLDGGRGHVATIRALLDELGFDIPVFGMVKDEYHKTRALSSDKEDISIAHEQAVFNFIYGLQEEVHRFTVSHMHQRRSTALRHSQLEDIPGIGPVKAKALLSHFRTISAIKEAECDTLAQAPSISRTDADNIYGYFHKDNEAVNHGK